jgi:diguanylate cyclase (GGDEF)-like protein
LVLVERQADALCRKEYTTQAPLPWTKEFRRVVEAMNRMTGKVKEMFEEQVAQAEELRKRAYCDPLTGLGNRRYFESQILARLAQDNGCTQGFALLFRVHGLDKLNIQKGFLSGDELLKGVALLLQESAAQYTNSVLAHLTGGDFGIFVPDASPWDAELIATGLMGRVKKFATEQIAATENIGHAGVATYESETTLARLLSEADLSLGAAMRKGPNCWDIRAITKEAEELPLGKQQWKDILVKALQESRIRLFAQPVVDNSGSGRILHMEIFSKIVLDDGNLLHASIFMPLAERLKLVSTIDRIVIEKLMKIDRNQLGADRIAVNISPSSLLDEGFSKQILSFLGSLSSGVPRIIFEFPEFAALQELALIEKFGAAVRERGHAIGLDHYGQSFSKLGYLQSLRPDYVKIDSAYTGELNDKENDSRFYIRSLCSVAHSIDIAVIAEGVETEQQTQILRELNLDGVQGFFIGRPQPISTSAEGA